MNTVKLSIITCQVVVDPLTTTLHWLFLVSWIKLLLMDQKSDQVREDLIPFSEPNNVSFILGVNSIRRQWTSNHHVFSLSVLQQTNTAPCWSKRVGSSSSGTWLKWLRHDQKPRRWEGRFLYSMNTKCDHDLWVCSYLTVQSPSFPALVSGNKLRDHSFGLTVALHYVCPAPNTACICWPVTIKPRCLRWYACRWYTQGQRHLGI